MSDVLHAHSGDVVVMDLGGLELTDDVAGLRWHLRDLVLAGARTVIVDLATVPQLSSTTVATLLATHRLCRARGGRVLVRNPSRRVLDLLTRTGLCHVLQVEIQEGVGPGDVLAARPPASAPPTSRARPPEPRGRTSRPPHDGR